MALRLEEIFELVAQDVEKAGLLHYLRAGVFLCGGAVRTPNLAQMAEEIFEMPVTIGKANSISGLKSALDQPEFATAIGLVRFGSYKHRRRDTKSPISKGIKGVINRILNRP